VRKIKKSIFFKNDQKYFFSCQKYFFHVDSPPVWNKSVFEKILKNFPDPLQNFFWSRVRIPLETKFFCTNLEAWNVNLLKLWRFENRFTSIYASGLGPFFDPLVGPGPPKPCPHGGRRARASMGASALFGLCVWCGTTLPHHTTLVVWTTLPNSGREGGRKMWVERPIHWRLIVNFSFFLVANFSTPPGGGPNEGCRFFSKIPTWGAAHVCYWTIIF
jgi:hypothetical protein